MREKRSERRPFDKEVERRCPADWDSVACVSVLLLFAVGSLHAEKVASRKGPVLSIAWSSGGMILAAASSNQTVKPMDGNEGKPRASLEGYTGDVYSIAWSPNGKILATGSDDRTVKLWDAATGKMLADLPGHTDAICSVAWSPNGKTLASSAGDATLKLWDAATGKCWSAWWDTLGMSAALRGVRMGRPWLRAVLTRH
jgi:WD40 repeat protein